MAKWFINLEVITILIIYSPNNRALKYEVKTYKTAKKKKKNYNDCWMF